MDEVHLTANENGNDLEGTCSFENICFEMFTEWR